MNERMSSVSTDGGQVPDGDGACLATNDQCASILQQLHRTDVVIALLVTSHSHKPIVNQGLGKAGSGVR